METASIALASPLQLKVESVDPKSIKPYPNNARTHSKKQIGEIKASIREFTFTNPVLVDQNGFIIAGHGRWLAAIELGLAEIPIIRLGWLSEAQVRALRLADNKIALNSGWDVDLLRLEIADLKAMDVQFDLSITGFTGGEIDVLMGDKADPDDEVIPAVPSTPRTKPGDIYALGDNHRVGCGDGRDEDFVRAVVGKNALVDCAFLDGPYNVPIQGHANTKSRHREFLMGSGEMTDAGFGTFLTETFGACVNVSRDGAVHFICMDWRHYDAVSAVCKELYGAQLNLCVWNKSNAGMGSLYRSKHELVFVYRVGDAPHLNAVELGRHGRNRTNVWDYASVNTFQKARKADLELHPTVKPTAMVADAIQDVTRRGDLVLDIFLGSGTTLIACERSGRKFRGLDIDPAYVDVAIDRWVAMTGGTPRRITGWDA